MGKVQLSRGLDALSLLLAFALSVLYPVVQGNAQIIIEFPIPTASSYPYGITVYNGLVYLTEEAGNDIGRLDLDHTFFHPHTELWFTWYDLVNAQVDNIHFVNPGASTATITIYIAGVQKDSFALAVGQSTYRNYAGVMGGPVHIVSDRPIWCTQRIVGWGSFKEASGLPGDMAATEIYYTWYDMKFAGSDAIHILNPSGTQTAHVDVYIAGVKKSSTPIAIDPGEATYVTYPGEIGGPVRIVSDVPIFSTQRVVGWSDFDEVVGMPSWYVFRENWFNWYDSAGASIDNVHFINPGSSIANIQVYVSGVLRGSYALDPGSANYISYPSLTGGPVRVVSDQPIWCTQRIVGWSGFKEEFSVPTQHMSKKWFFNWYDEVNAQTDNIHFLNPGSSDAHVSVTIAGASYGLYTVPAGGAYYISYPGVCNGPVIVESDVSIMTSQRIVGWDSFEEILGVDTSTAFAPYKVYGLNFGPYIKEGQDPDLKTPISEGQIRELLTIIAPYTKWVRTFGCTDGIEKAGKIAHELGFKIAAGAWLGRDMDANEEQISSLINMCQNGEADMAIVGSEVLLRKDLTETQLIEYINRVKDAVKDIVPNIPVATADTYSMLLSHQAVMDAGDVVLPNYYPFWEGVSIDYAVYHVHLYHQDIMAAAKGKQVIVSETGWPSDGDPFGAAVPSSQNAAFHFLNFVSWAKAENVSYFVFEAFDEPWKAREGSVGAHWGIWDKDGNLKPGMEKVFNWETLPNNWGTEIIDGPGDSAIEFTYVPPYGSSEYLEGRVSHVKPADYRVAVYIKVGSGWWTKPYWAWPLTIIEPDGSWVCDIVTGGIDEQATEIAAFLLPRGYDPPLMSGQSVLPPELNGNALAWVNVTRMPGDIGFRHTPTR